MAQSLQFLNEYGLLAVALVVLVEQLGAPVPALPMLFLAGAATAGDASRMVATLAAATAASLVADSLWFAAGRYRGRQVLSLLCRISLSPDSCVRQSEVSFARRGVATLVIAKFVPGLSTLAPPLAGALGMETRSFLLFNGAGTALWAGSGLFAGVLFHAQVDEMLALAARFGRYALGGVVVLLAVYVFLRLLRRWRQKRRDARIPRVLPGDLASALERGDSVVIVDVRAPLPGVSDAGKIPGARVVDLGGLASPRKASGLPPELADLPEGVTLVTYCACPNDASAAKAAHLLQQRGFGVQVLRGGYGAWTEAGLPLEP